MTGQRGRPKKGVESDKLWSSKDYVSNYNKEYYEKKKNDANSMVMCECKKLVSKAYMEKHKQTQYHKNVVKMLDELASQKTG
jgi:hypothetical protein